MFRTPTGQTGTDAYAYEAAQIENSLRDLNARAARLAEAMAQELADDVVVLIAIPSQRYPDATMPADHEGLQRMLPMMGIAADAHMLGEYARALADPTYVVRSDLERG